MSWIQALVLVLFLLSRSVIKGQSYNVSRKLFPGESYWHLNKLFYGKTKSKTDFINININRDSNKNDQTRGSRLRRFMASEKVPFAETESEKDHADDGGEEVLPLQNLPNGLINKEHLEDIIFSSNDVIVQSNVIDVLYGRRTAVSPIQHLNINVREKDKCTVKVIDSGLALPRAGILMPSEFNCQFEPNSIVYSHLGALNPKEETIKLMIKYETDRETFVIPTILRIRVVYDTQLEIVTKNVPLKVVSDSLLSDSFSSRNTVFLYNISEYDCVITVLSDGTDFPRYGKIFSSIVNLARDPFLSCDKFLNSNIRYEHMFPSSVRTDYIPAKIQLYDKRNGTLMKQEYFHKTVIIPYGKFDSAPKVSGNSSIHIDVYHSNLTPITKSTLSFYDNDTPAQRLLVVVKQFDDVDGKLVSTDSPLVPLTSFYQKDIEDLKIAYTPAESSHNRTTSKITKITLAAVDEGGTSSDIFDLTVVLHPWINGQPANQHLKSLEVMEGDATHNRIFYNSDIDYSADIGSAHYYIKDGLQHGKILVNGTSSKSFTASDITNGRVAYEHDGSDYSSDNLLLQYNDSEIFTDMLLPISVYPVDDVPPNLLHQNNLEIAAGKECQLTEFHLKAFDPDSDSDLIVYKLLSPFPKYGDFMLRQNGPPLISSLYRYVGKQTLTWTQRDILLGHLYFIANNYHKNINGSELVYFFLSNSDGDSPDYFQRQNFEVKVYPDNSTLPYLYEVSNLPLSAFEHQRIPVTKESLVYETHNNLDRDTNITYSFETNRMTGSFIFSENRFMSKFTQTQINENKVFYQPPNIEIGINVKILHIRFNVSDTLANTLTNQSLVIHIKPVNNKPPVVHIAAAQIPMGANGTVITQDTLNVLDEDTDEDELLLRIVTVPRYGSVLYKKHKLISGSELTLKDIENGHVRYEVDFSNSSFKNDSFVIEIDDRVHQVQYPIDITHESVDSETLSTLTESLNPSLTVTEGNKVLLPTTILLAESRDIRNVTFIIEKAPEHGMILRNNRPVLKFTWKDLQNKTVSYLHNSGEIGMEDRNDQFRLILTEGSAEFTTGQKVIPINVTVTIKPMDNSPPTVSKIIPVTVEESSQIAIGSKNFNITDPDTEINKIVCVITRQSSLGSLDIAAGVKKNKSVSAFTERQLHAQYLLYVQNVYKKIEPRNDSFSFYCTDGINISPEQDLQIMISPVNDELPDTTIHVITVEEGSRVQINRSHIRTYDLDEPQDAITYTIFSLPKHGWFVKQQFNLTYSSFSEDDLSAGMIWYYHDGSETTSDYFNIIVSDGNKDHNQHVAGVIKVVPVSDQPPKIENNKGIRLKSNGSKIISRSNLSSLDLDSKDDKIFYIVKAIPVFGYLEILSPTSKLPIAKVELEDYFTQEDINSKIIQYRNTDLRGTNDSFTFQLSDGENKEMKEHVFNIKIKDAIAPIVTSKGVEVKKGKWVYLTSELLNAIDPNTKDENINYTITRGPLKGKLMHIDFPDDKVLSFSQLDIANTKVLYIHNSKDGDNLDDFEFSVTDGTNVVQNMFQINIRDDNKEKPVLFVRDIEVGKGRSVILTESYLKIEDDDSSSPDELMFVIRRYPQFGTIVMGQSTKVGNFTQTDVNDMKIYYHHDGSDSQEDNFYITVSDKNYNEFFVFPNVDELTTKPQRVKIKIISLEERQHDSLIVKDGFQQGLQPEYYPRNLFKGFKAKLVFKITKSNLNTESNNRPSAIVYIIEETPKHGYICNIDDIMNPISAFTQEDINSDVIRFVFNGNSKATEDIVKFKVMDRETGFAKLQTIHLEWSFVRIEKDFYVANRSEDLVINLNRRGSLRSSAYVNVTVHSPAGLPIKTQQVHFGPGEKKVKWTYKSAKGGLNRSPHNYQSDTSHVVLGNGVMTALEEPREAIVVQRDSLKESIVEFLVGTVTVAERSEKTKLALKRWGDISKLQNIICYTVSGSAVGSKKDGAQSFSDYVSRPNDASSIIRFEMGQSEAYCEVQITDDAVIEKDESFEVYLRASSAGVRIGNKNTVKVIIEEDIIDYPQIFFSRAEYFVEESLGEVEIWILRSGTDLGCSSSVRVVSKSPKGNSSYSAAKPGEDYLTVDTLVTFMPESRSERVLVSVLDDRERPRLERHEQFILVLRNPQNATVKDRNEVTVVIDDSASDVPVIEFTSEEYRIRETDGAVKALLRRRGDVSQRDSVRCSTTSGTAIDTEDYVPRPDSELSQVVFAPGDTESSCEITLMDDRIYEKEESFLVFLSFPEVAVGKAIIGNKNFAKIFITDPEDEPHLLFETPRLLVKEPLGVGSVHQMKVNIKRSGDTSSWVQFRVFSEDRSATSGEDYISFNKELFFHPNSSLMEINVQILGDSKEEPRETFILNLEVVRSSSAWEFKVTNSKVAVFIQDSAINKDTVFPAPPVIVSMKYFGSYNGNQSYVPLVPPGYPLLCLTACDEQHPSYSKTKHLCKTQNIDNNVTKFRWQVAVQEDFSNKKLTSKDYKTQSTVTEDVITQRGREAMASQQWKDIPQVFFRESDRILDILFIVPKTSVRCCVTAVSSEGYSGFESLSHSVTVGDGDENCHKNNGTHLDVEPYVARLKYKDTSDGEILSTVCVEILVPHQDRMIPLISTNRISDLGFTLPSDSYRVPTHRCSNMLDFMEKQVKYGFYSAGDTTTGVLYSDGTGFETSVRMRSTDRFYNQLNRQSCLWRWSGFFTIPELLSQCGAKIVSEEQGSDATQNRLTLSIPLFVTYFFFTPDVENGWKYVHQSSELRLNLEYATSLLPADDYRRSRADLPYNHSNTNRGTLVVNGIRTERDGRFAIDFTTETRFRGKFILHHPVTFEKSEVTSVDYPDLTFTLLKLDQASQATSSSNKQRWKFMSDIVTQDYSGTYIISLIPCLFASGSDTNDKFVSSDSCYTEDIITFTMKIRLQQAMNPVAERFSLNTRLRITRNRDTWLNATAVESESDNDVVFYYGDRVYGLVHMDPVASTAGSFQISIDKCYVCTGFHGYMPRFDPKNREFGCIQDTEDILTYKIIDKRDTTESDVRISDIPFRARLMTEETDSHHFSQFQMRQNMAGFSFDVKPLFQVSEGARWFVHVIFTIRRKDTRITRSALLGALMNNTVSLSDYDDSQSSHNYFLNKTLSGKDKRIHLKSVSLENIGTKGLGTNMHDFYLKFTQKNDNFTLVDWTFLHRFLSIFFGLSLLILSAAITLIIIWKKRNMSMDSTGFYSTVPMSDKTINHTQDSTDENRTPKVLSYYSSNDEVTEV